jgi:hypothetical protein
MVIQVRTRGKRRRLVTQLETVAQAGAGSLGHGLVKKHRDEP